jgi:hypothetical protein
MADNSEAWVKRAKEILAKGMWAPEAIAFAPSMLAALYGQQSAQLAAFNSRMTEISRAKDNANYERQAHAVSTIENTIGEVENGLISNLRAQVAGEVLAELVSLGKTFSRTTLSHRRTYRPY